MTDNQHNLQLFPFENVIYVKVNDRKTTSREN